MIREDDLFEINEAKQTPELGDQFPSQELFSISTHIRAGFSNRNS